MYVFLCLNTYRKICPIKGLNLKFSFGRTQNVYFINYLTVVYQSEGE